MRVLIPGLLVLAGYLEAPRPPSPQITWTGPLPAVKWDSLPTDGDPWLTDESLVFVKIQEPGTYRVTFSTGTLAKAEAETQDGQALFILTQGLFPLNNFSITATTSFLPDVDPFRGFEDLDGSIIGGFFPKGYYPVPLAVEIVIVPLNVEWKLCIRPCGFLDQWTKQCKPSPVRRRFSLNLVAVGQNMPARFLNLEGGKNYCTGHFSLTNPSREPADPFTPHLFLRDRTRFLSGLSADSQPLNGMLFAEQILDRGSTHIKPVESQKARAAWCNECHVFVPNDDKDPDVIIIRTYPGPKKPESDDPFRFLNGLTIGGVGLTF